MLLIPEQFLCFMQQQHMKCPNADYTNPRKHQDLFRNIPDKTSVAEHFIPTDGNTVKILCRILANY